VAAPPRTLVFRSFAFALHEPGIVAGWTERWGGVSEPPYDDLNLALHVGDGQTAVLENRRRVAAALGIELETFVFGEQVHGAAVHVATAEDRGRGASALQTAVTGVDALVTATPGLVLAVLVADCVPLVLYDADTPAVGIAHAGWRGTVAHVARATVEAMTSAFGTDPGRLRVALGPSIGPESYEVGDDVAARVREEFASSSVLRAGSGKWSLDLRSANAGELQSAGVPRGRIETAPADTFTESASLFSHRRGAPTGRFLAAAGLQAV